MTAAASLRHEATSRPSRALGRLDVLLDRSTSELAQLYASARTPKLEDVRGDLAGRMLAWPVLDRRPFLSGALRAFAGSSGFPWRGKSFMPHDDMRGEGINRVLSDRFRLFRFDTFVAPSKAGVGDAVQLDYDLDGNPPIIRSIKDEIRELEPGLWLGQAYYQLRSGGHWLWLYFALARRD